MSYSIRIKDSAERALDRLPRKVLPKVDERILALAANPRSPGCRKLAGQDNLWRVRVGDWRVVYQIRDEHLIVLVVMVAHRREAYRGL